VWAVKRRTAVNRFQRAIRKIAQWCRRNLHQPIKEQHRELSAKLRGHYDYYGITSNGEALQRFRSAVQRTWRHWLSRRKRGTYSWDCFAQLQERYPLPRACVVHSVYRSRSEPVI
jgi:hypothetical protein